jgi:tRNA-splicing ligase RtcB
MAEAFKGPLEQIDQYRWRIPRKYKPAMRTDGIIYISPELLEAMRGDNAPEQVANVACLPGIVGFSLAMPDIHYGYGFPIGGVAATSVDEGVISPGGVGYDINCGVRLLRTNLDKDELAPRLEALLNQVARDVPSGVGSEGRLRVNQKELEQVMIKGAKWAVGQGYGDRADLEACEANGQLAGAAPDNASARAKQRGLPQLGTLGAGNHFLEVQEVEEIYEPQIAQSLGIDHPGQITVMIHTGSRGLGYQVCDDYLITMREAVHKYGIDLPDRELVCAPVKSGEGKAYFGAMACAANYAWANRQAITHWVRQAFERIFGVGVAKLGLELVYDVAHNIAKIEEHEVDGETETLCVHRKGATRAFGPGHPELSERHREIGQPVIVPGDMGRASFLLVGTEGAMRDTWGSTCHGAGRRMSRTQALKTATSQEVVQQLKEKGILIRAASKKTIAEEAPHAYKDVSQVVEACHGAGISRKVAKFRPLGVVKG